MSDTQALVIAPIAEIRAKLADKRYYQLIKDVHCPKASDLEFRHCMATAHHLGLDPIARQIFFIPVFDSRLKREQWVPIVAVAGLLAIAQRTGEYCGRTRPQWCGQNGEWRDVWLDDGPPAAAQVAVYREGYVEPLVGVVMYREYCRRTKDGRPMAQWGTMPAHMLYKCALSQALRTSFPQEMAGDYGVRDVSMPGEPGRFRHRDDTPQLTDGSAAEADETEGILALIKAVRTAGSAKALDKATEALKEFELTDALREVAKQAWVEANERLASKRKKNGKTKAKAKAEPADPLKAVAPNETARAAKILQAEMAEMDRKAAGKHDYGPPAWDERQPADASKPADPGQPEFGFGAKGDQQ